MHRNECARIRLGAEHLRTAFHGWPETPVNREKGDVTRKPCQPFHLFPKAVLGKLTVHLGVPCPIPPVEITGMEDTLSVRLDEERCSLIRRGERGHGYALILPRIVTADPRGLILRNPCCSCILTNVLTEDIACGVCRKIGNHRIKVVKMCM